MSSGFYKLRAAFTWKAWCDEEVLYVTNDEIPRKVLIMDLVRNGIIPFFKKRGYVFGCDAHRIAECIARYLYFRRVSHDSINWDYRLEDYEHYYYTIDDDTWEDFWDRWAHWSDLEDVKVREGVRFCVWTLLDLYKSPVTDEVDEMLGLNDEESNTAREDTRDPYLIDSANGYFSAI